MDLPLDVDVGSKVPGGTHVQTIDRHRQMLAAGGATGAGWACANSGAVARDSTTITSVMSTVTIERYTSSNMMMMTVNVAASSGPGNGSACRNGGAARVPGGERDQRAVDRDLPDLPAPSRILHYPTCLPDIQAVNELISASLTQGGRNAGPCQTRALCSVLDHRLGRASCLSQMLAPSGGHLAQVVPSRLAGWLGGI